MLAALALGQGSPAKAPRYVNVGAAAFSKKDGRKSKGWKPPVYTLLLNGTLQFVTTEQASTGYAWSEPTFSTKGIVQKSKAAILKELKPSEPPIVGGDLRDVALRFRPLKPGRTTVTMAYERKTTPPHVDQVHVVRFVVVVTPAARE